MTMQRATITVRNKTPSVPAEFHQAVMTDDGYDSGF